MQPITLQALNDASAERFVELLQGVYEHSPWVSQRASALRPFSTRAALQHALCQAVQQAPRADQLNLIRAHPELAGKAQIGSDPKSLTPESALEQSRAGLTHCLPEEFEQLHMLNRAYRDKFGWPFILAVRGPRGIGLTRTQIINTLDRRLHGHPDFEFAECLRNIHRIAEIRLDDKFAQEPVAGQHVWDWAEALSVHSDPGFKEQGQLTVTYLTAAHQACAQQLASWMQSCGFDEVSIDAVGNVVGRYAGARPAAPYLLTGSHYDTVRNGGKYDGRLGILVPMACVHELHQQGQRLPFGIEVVAFAEEEGQRYKATFLGSGALTGDFDPQWLQQTDAQHISMSQAMQQAGLSAHLADIQALQRNPSDYLGFVEVHIEQGPVLNEMNLPLGVVTSINGSVRYLCEVVGVASHAGTTPMDRRRDAAAAAAELILYVEQRARAVPEVVGTVGLLEVPAGSINVVPGRCRFSLDLRATTNEARDALAADVLAELGRICDRRGLSHTLERTLAVPAAPSHPAWQARWEAAVTALGLPVFRMPSGAGHDAMKLHEIMPQAMLFVRGLNAGISHNPLESITAHDADLCVQAFRHLLHHLT